MSQQSKRSVLISVDDEGFTNQRCRNCKARLSIEEVQVFIGKESMDKVICLNCYAMIVEKRIKDRRRASVGKIDVGTETLKDLERGSGRTSSVKMNSVKQSSRKSERDNQIIADIQHRRKKTDVTLFANASFNGGVFLNAIPGQSI